MKDICVNVIKNTIKGLSTGVCVSAGLMTVYSLGIITGVVAQQIAEDEGKYKITQHVTYRKENNESE